MRTGVPGIAAAARSAAGKKRRRTSFHIHGVLSAAAFAWLLTMIGPAAAQQASLGQAVAVLPAAIGELGGQQVTIIQGSQLFEGQTISTGPTGEVQIVFVDNTRMVIGPNSALVIERYLLRDPSTFGELAVNALGGTFRFISGNSPSDTYTMRVPGGTIGVRGTAFQATVSWEDGAAAVMVENGSVFLCPDGIESCTVLVERCSVGTLIGGLRANVIRNEYTRAEIALEKFLYAGNQQLALLPEFRVGNADECLAELIEVAEEEPAAPTPPPPAPPPPPPPPPPPEPEPEECAKNNRGLGNGEECATGEVERDNPGRNNGPNGNAFGLDR